MIVTLSNCSKRAQFEIRNISSMRPVPQVDAWIGCARKFQKTGAMLEAAVLIDLMATHFGKDIGRRIWQEFDTIPVSVRGRGCGIADDTIAVSGAPVIIGADVYVPAGMFITCCNLVEGWKKRIELDSLRNNALRLAKIRLASCAGQLAVAYGDRIFRVLDDGKLSEAVSFDANIVGICGGIDDDALFVMTAPKIVPCAPDCFIVRNFLSTPEIIPIPNVEQSLWGDCAPAAHGWITCCGGMQKSEVRFIHTDGSWETRFPSEKNIVRVAPSEAGPVSIDESGHAFLWNGLTICDDKIFALEKVPASAFEQIGNMQASVDWNHGRLYLMPKGENAASWTVTELEARSGSYLRQLYPTAWGITVALLADGHYHFWDTNSLSVVPAWQLPESCADSDDWHALLDNRIRLSVDDDPRIRRVVLDT